MAGISQKTEKKQKMSSKKHNTVSKIKPKKNSNNTPSWLCSGYGVSPSGKKCKGCIDCGWGDKVMSKSQIKKDINSRTIKVSKNTTLLNVIDKLIKERK